MLPSFAEIEVLRRDARVLRVEERFAVPRATLWRYVRQLDLVNRRAGNPPADYTFAPMEGGGTVALAVARKAGFKMRYAELPYEWIQREEVAGEIFLAQGPLRYAGIGATMADDGEGTLLRFSVSFVGRPHIVPGSFLAGRVFKQYASMLRRLEADLRPESDYLDISAFPPLPAGLTRAAALAAEWAHLSPSAEVAARLAEFVLTAPDVHVNRLRPLAIARHYGLPPEDVVRLALRAARAGFLAVSWDLLCPSCRGAKARAAHLVDFGGEAHCDSCNIRFGAEFDRNVELTFRPHPRVREVQDRSYCFHSPSNTAHVVHQLNLMPNEKRDRALVFGSGSYRITSPSARGARALVVREGGARELALGLDELNDGAPLECAPSVRVSLENTTPLFVTMRFEDDRLRGDALTAAEVTAMQEFRDQFGSEVLRPGLSVAVSSVALLFTDLKGSTELYERCGDAPACALVQRHFEAMREVIARHGGGIVKTIGDAVMAAFPRTAMAVEASLDILEVFAAWPEEEAAGRPVVKLGVHEGPAIVISQNEQLDYFGATVNRAARVQSAAGGMEVVVSDAVLADPAVKALLEARGVTIEHFEEQFKGIAAPMPVHRIRLRSPA